MKKNEEIWNNQWGVGKIQCFSHMTLQIAVVHLSPSGKDLTMKFYPVICHGLTKISHILLEMNHIVFKNNKHYRFK